MVHQPLVLIFGFGKTTRTFFPTSKPLNIWDGALFVVCFVLNTLFLLFCGILSSNCICCAYLVAVYTVNTQSTTFCLFLTAENFPLSFGFVLWFSKNHLQISCCSLHSKYTKMPLFFFSNRWKHSIYFCCYHLDFKTSTVPFFHLPNI